MSSLTNHADIANRNSPQTQDLPSREFKCSRILLVFDFDHTLINANSDLILFQSPPDAPHVTPLPYATHLVSNFTTLRGECIRSGGGGWTEMMRRQLRDLSMCDGYKKSDVVDCMRTVKMDPTLIEALRKLRRQVWVEANEHKVDDSGQLDLSMTGFHETDEVDARNEGHRSDRSKGMTTSGNKEWRRNVKVKMAIASDANSIFIDEILKANGLIRVFDAIYTNPAQWTSKRELDLDHKDTSTEREQGVHQKTVKNESSGKNNKGDVGTDGEGEKDMLHLEPYQPFSSPHNCPRCSANMCKTTVVQRARKELFSSDRDTKGEIDQTDDVLTIYVGDGHNDLCPCLNLTENDVVLAREGYALGRLITEAEVRAKQAATAGDDNSGSESVNATRSTSPTKVVAQVRVWKTQEELAEMLTHLISRLRLE